MDTDDTDDMSLADINYHIINNIAVLSSRAPAPYTGVSHDIRIVIKYFPLALGGNTYTAGVLCDNERFIQGRAGSTPREAIEFLLYATMEAVHADRSRMFFSSSGEDGVSMALTRSGGRMRAPPAGRSLLEELST